jgi:hypothetical protein
MSYNYSFHNFTSLKLETRLLCPVSLQASHLKKNPHSTSAFLTCLQPTSKSLKVILHVLNREHLVEQLGCRANK